MQANAIKKANQNKLRTSKVTFKESLMGACTNIMYKLGAIGGLKRVPQLLKTSPCSKESFILGQLITDKMVAKQRLSKIIWFTYRQKLNIAQDINSDVGWGCLPRVGQMMMAQALVRHFCNKGIKMDQKQYLKIIEPFLDESQESANYSLSMLLKYARWKFAINPGQWFNIGQLSDVLRKIQEERPLKGSQKLKLVFFSQSVIFINLITEKAQVRPCKCADKKILCIICNERQCAQLDQKQKQISKQEYVMNIQEYDSGCQKVIESTSKNANIQIIQLPLPEQMCKKWQIYDNSNEKQWAESNAIQAQSKASKANQPLSTEPPNKQAELQNHLLLIVSVRTSQKIIDPFDYAAILSLLSMPSSLGIVGGVPGKALYIVGYEGDEVIYLDPHYVQEHVDKDNFQMHLHTFFCTEYRTINRQALDPSMAFCFYLKTIEDIQNLLIRIQEIKQSYAKHGKNFFISVMERNIYDENENYEYANNESPDKFVTSFEYNSLEFRDIADSF